MGVNKGLYNNEDVDNGGSDQIDWHKVVGREKITENKSSGGDG